ncbi:MAG: hypothetical protein ACLPY5_12125 [Candidatus Bathyarchaeia archaeon]
MAEERNNRAYVSRISLAESPVTRLSGRCWGCNGLIIYSDDDGKTWRHYDGAVHKQGHLVDFHPDDAVAADLPKEHKESSLENITPVERACAEVKADGLALATDPALLYRTKLELDEKIFREDTSKLLLFLTCASAITTRPLSAVITSESAAGKSNLLHSVIAHFPNVEYFTRVTPASIDRMGNDLTGRILVVEELRGADAAQGTLRVAISEGKLRLLTTERDEKGKIVNREIETKGTAVFLTTTTSTVIDWETQTRLLVISLDESPQQTEGVMKYEAQEYEDVAPRKGEHSKLSSFLGTLLPYDVLIPYASQLVGCFPSKKLSARRDFKKLLQLIVIITFCHQHQRLRVRKRIQPLQYRLVATPLDLRYAIQIAGESLRQNVAGVPKRVHDLLQYFKEGEAQTTRSIAHAARIGQRTARRWLGEDLVQAGFLTVDETGKEHLYYLADQQEASLFSDGTVPSEVLFWDDNETKGWLNRQGFEILSDPGTPTFVDPFTGVVSESPLTLQRPMAATQTEQKTTVSHGQTAEIAVRPQVAADLSSNSNAANGQPSEHRGLDKFTSSGAVA